MKNTFWPFTLRICEIFLYVGLPAFGTLLLMLIFLIPRQQHTSEMETSFFIAKIAAF